MKRTPDGVIVEATVNELQDALDQQSDSLNALTLLVDGYRMQPNTDDVLPGLAALLRQLHVRASECAEMVDVLTTQRRRRKAKPDAKN